MMMSIYISIMNGMDQEQRARILHLLCEGNSIRSIMRLMNVGKNTVARLMVDDPLEGFALPVTLHVRRTKLELCR